MLHPHAIAHSRFRLYPFSLATTGGVEVSFLSSGYLDVSVRLLTFLTLCVQVRMTGHYPSRVSLIRRSAGQRLFSASPRLIAAVHVLHRLLVPRHPPSALIILTEEHHMSLCRFQGTRGSDVPHGRTAPEARSFKTEQRGARSCLGSLAAMSTFFQVASRSPAGKPSVRKRHIAINDTRSPAVLDTANP